jgi:hypothetical protein
MPGRKRDRSAFFRSTGRGLIPAETKAEEILFSMGKDALLRVTLTKPRRHKHHKFYFATLGNYFDNWPEAHPFQPDNEEHLRAWATVKAGHRDLLGERLDHGPGDVVAMAGFVSRCLERQRKHGYGFITIHNGSLVFATPRSIAYDALDEAEFAPIAAQILGVLEQESGLPLSTMYIDPKEPAQ